MRALSQREVEDIMSSLSEDQRSYIIKHTKQSKKSKWIETLAKKKGIVLSENMSLEVVEDKLDEWMLVDVLDGGYGNRPYECECGKSLRFQYIVYHKGDDKTYKLGETCFEHYTDLQPEVLKDILKGFHHVDLERDEILLKLKQKRYPDLTKYLVIDSIPAELKKQIQLLIPLSNSQLGNIQHLMNEHDLQIKRNEVYKGLTSQQLLVFNSLDSKEKVEVLTTISNRTGYLVDKEDAEMIGDPGIIQFASVHLPLLKRHIKIFKKFVEELERKEWEDAKERARAVDYATLIENHKYHFKKLLELENVMSPGLRQECEEMKQSIKSIKNGGTIDYESFSVILNNLLTALKI
ncbi:hypothetical protein ACFFHF_17110 [Robertmurraya beringensis]|uniref:Uncharacterized protein n=1 Tax=Robertmurraya beringensis TaxID=641660 RepID=A0ABV6KUC3_9BACI